MNKIPQAAVSILLALTVGPAMAQAPSSSGTAQNAQGTQETAEPQARRAEMRREVDEAARAIGAYSQAERDQALQRAKSALDAMDRRIENARRDWESETARMTAEARERRERAMTELRARRTEAAERYRALQEASSGTWERVKEQFVTSYRSLADGIRRLWDSSDGTSPAGQKPGTPAEPEEAGKKDH